jgi:hypothetical protein
MVSWDALAEELVQALEVRAVVLVVQAVVVALPYWAWVV